MVNLTSVYLVSHRPCYGPYCSFPRWFQCDATARRSSPAHIYKDLHIVTHSLRALPFRWHPSGEIMFVIGKSTRNTGGWLLLSSGMLLLLMLLALLMFGKNARVHPRLGSGPGFSKLRPEIVESRYSAGLKPGAEDAPESAPRPGPA